MIHLTNLGLTAQQEEALLAMLADYTSIRTELIALMADMTALRATLAGMALSDGGISIGTTATDARTNATVSYLVDGVFYSLASTDDFWDLTGFDCTNGNYNICLLCVDNLGAAQISAGTEAATEAGVTLGSIPADSAVVGTVLVNPTGTGDFTGGTTDLDDATVVPNAVYTDRALLAAAIGSLTASAPDSVSVTR